MEELTQASGNECVLPMRDTRVYVVGSLALLEERTMPGGTLSVQVVGGQREAGHRSAGIEETCWWIIKDPPGVEEGYYLVGPVSRKGIMLSGEDY